MPKKKTKLISIRLSKSEHHALTIRSNKAALSTYIRSVLFSKTSTTPIDHKKDLAQILAKLGQSNIAPNLRELTHQARSGSLALSSETTAKLEQACNDISEIKFMIMKALRIKED